MPNLSLIIVLFSVLVWFTVTKGEEIGLIPERKCGGPMEGNNGVIFSPKADNGKYPPNAKCQWTIKVPKGYVVNITFVLLDVEDDSECLYDAVLLYDVMEGKESPDDYKPDLLLGRKLFCGRNLPDPILSYTNFVGVYFSSDEGLQEFGFEIRWSAVKIEDQFNCTFEDGLCRGWQNLVEPDDHFDWTINKGRTQTAGTGPIYDHTISNGDGWYAYIESSAPQRENDTAILSTPEIIFAEDEEKMCINFWYHMNGYHVHTLFVVQATGTSKETLWEKNGNHGEQWLQGMVEAAYTTSPFKIFFIGIRGRFPQGDIAIDDIAIWSGPCSHLADHKDSASPSGGETKIKDSTPVVSVITEASLETTHQFPEATQTGVDSTTPQILKTTQQHVNFTTKPLLKTTQQIMDSITRQVIKSTAPSVDSTLNEVLKTTQPTVDSTPKQVLKTTQPTVGSTTKQVLKTTQPIVDSTPKQVLKTTQPTVDSTPKQVLKATQPTVDSTTKQVLKTTQPIVDSTPKQVLKTTQQTVDSTPKPEVKATQPTVDSTPKPEVKATQPTVDFTTKQLVKMTQPIVHSTTMRIITTTQHISSTTKQDVPVTNASIEIEQQTSEEWETRETDTQSLTFTKGALMTESPSVSVMSQKKTVTIPATKLMVTIGSRPDGEAEPSIAGPSTSSIGTHSTETNATLNHPVSLNNSNAATTQPSPSRSTSAKSPNDIVDMTSKFVTSLPLTSHTKEMGGSDPTTSTPAGSANKPAHLSLLIFLSHSTAVVIVAKWL